MGYSFGPGCRDDWSRHSNSPRLASNRSRLPLVVPIVLPPSPTASHRSSPNPPIHTVDTSSLWDTGSQEPDLLYIHGGLFAPGTLPEPKKEIYLSSTEPWTLRYLNCIQAQKEVKSVSS